jgi:hypothetical protein
VHFKPPSVKLRIPKVANCCFSIGPDITFLWSKTAESQLEKGDKYMAEFAQLSFLPHYFRDSQLSPSADFTLKKS